MSQTDNPNPPVKEGDNPPVVDNQGDWRTGLPENIRGEKSFEAIKGKDWGEAGPKLATQYLEAQKYNVGAIRIPKPDAPQAEWDAYYAKLGRPEAADKYDLALGTLPEGMSWDDGMVTSFREAAHRAGLNGKQAKELSDWYTRTLWDQDGKNVATAKETLAELEKEWGGAFKRNVALSQRAAAEWGGPEMVAWLDKSGLGNNPLLVKFFARLGHELLEDNLIGERDEMIGSESAKDQIAKIMGDPKHPYFDRNHPEHEAAFKKVTALYQLAYQTV